MGYIINGVLNESKPFFELNDADLFGSGIWRIRNGVSSSGALDFFRVGSSNPTLFLSSSQVGINSATVPLETTLLIRSHASTQGAHVDARTTNDFGGSIFDAQSPNFDTTFSSIYLAYYPSLIWGTRFGVSQANSGQLVTGGSELTSMLIGSVQNTPIVFGNNDIERMRIAETTGYIGINTNDPTQVLDVNGNARFRAIENTAATNLLGVDGDGVLSTNISTLTANWNEAHGWGNHTGLYAPINLSENWEDAITNNKVGFNSNADGTPVYGTHFGFNVTLQGNSNYGGAFIMRNNRAYFQTREVAILQGWSEFYHTGNFIAGTHYQAPLNNPVTGTGVANRVAKFNALSGITESQITDNGTNIGFKQISPVTDFDFNGISNHSGLSRRMFTTATATSLHFRKYYDVAHFANGTSTVAGDIRIEIPVSTSTMWTMEVFITEYNASNVDNVKGTTLKLSGYTTTNINRSVLTDNPNRITKVRWGRNTANNKTVILITPASTLRYPKFYIKEITTSHGNESTFLNPDNYALNITTDENDFTLQGEILNAGFIRDSFYAPASTALTTSVTNVLVNNNLPRWDSANSRFINSGIVDDGTVINASRNIDLGFNSEPLIIKRQPVTTGGWARGVFHFRDVNNNTLFSLGAYGSSGGWDYNYLGRDNLNNAIRWNDTGVGIFTPTTTQPTQALDVNGNARFRAITGITAAANLLGVTTDGTLTTKVDTLSLITQIIGIPPGPSMYFGTNESNILGWHNLPS
jgi:hypothetical protein